MTSRDTKMSEIICKSDFVSLDEEYLLAWNNSSIKSSLYTKDS